MLHFYSLFESLQEVSSYSRVKLKSTVDDLEKSSKSGSDTPRSKRKKYKGTSRKSPPMTKLDGNILAIVEQLIKFSTLLELKTFAISR